MVFTIEPELRVPEEQIYVRLEDLIVVTDKGRDIQSDFVPLDMNQVETIMFHLRIGAFSSQSETR